jgi:hypothetical protein
MRTVLAFSVLLSLALASPASATCLGSAAFSTCTDEDGNTYNIQRFGNQTIVTGDGGSAYSQQFGNTTYLNGQASDGSSWSGSQEHIGNMDIYSGTDTEGNSYSRTCGPKGCY